MKLVVFLSITDFLECFEKKQRYKQQIDKLLTSSFPQFFPSNGTITIFSHLRNLINNRKILDDDIATFAKVHETDGIIGFVQLVREKNPAKLRIINLCRVRNNKYKGQGQKLISSVINYLELSNTSHLRVYLTVSASNTRLQDYYEALGWINTKRYDVKSHFPALEFAYLLNN